MTAVDPIGNITGFFSFSKVELVLSRIVASVRRLTFFDVSLRKANIDWDDRPSCVCQLERSGKRVSSSF